MTKPKPVPSHAKSLPWFAIVLDALIPHAGQTLPPGRVYAVVEQHVRAQRGTQADPFVHERIAAVFLTMHQAGLLRRIGPRRWQVSSELAGWSV